MPRKPKLGQKLTKLILHILRKHYLSLEEMGKGHAQKKWLHTNRASGSNCYYRIIDGNTDAGTAAS